MLTQRAYRYEVQPTAGQTTSMRRHADAARFAYNWGKATCDEHYAATGKHISFNELNKILNEIKREQFPWMLSVSARAPQCALRNLDKAYQNAFRNMKVGRKPGFPEFKKRGVAKSTFSFSEKIFVRGNRKIQLLTIGRLRTKDSTENFEGRIFGATVSCEADRWFVSLNVEVERPGPVNTSTDVVGVDLGLKTFATLSDGTTFESPRPLKKHLKRLQRVSRQHSRKRKGSNNRRRHALRLARLHRKIRNTRKDFLHKTTTMLAKTKRCIVVEDLAVKNMMRNRRLACSISDQGWAEFRRMLEYKMVWYGSTLQVIGRFEPTSKTCSSCGCVKSGLTLEDRVFVCPDCGLEIDRDLNAAINIRNLSTGSSPGSHACGEKSSGSKASASKRNSSRRSRNRTLALASS